eukprot:scaffold58118_cov37-Cyclotella_meneghiniana.AAC.5
MHWRRKGELKATIPIAVPENQENRDRSIRAKPAKQPVQETQQCKPDEDNEIEPSNQDFDRAFQNIHADIEFLSNCDSVTWKEGITSKMDYSLSDATLSTNAEDIEDFVNLSNLALNKCKVYDPHNRTSGLLVVFEGKRPTSEFLRGVARSITPTFLKDLIEKFGLPWLLLILWASFV